MSLTIGSAVLVAELIENLREKHTVVFQKIKEELCATDEEFERVFAEIVGKRTRYPEFTVYHYTPFSRTG